MYSHDHLAILFAVRLICIYLGYLCFTHSALQTSSTFESGNGYIYIWLICFV